MADAAAVAGKAAKEKNVDAVLDASDVLYTTCEDCHRQYVKK
jgi:cytochrome c556